MIGNAQNKQSSSPIPGEIWKVVKTRMWGFKFDTGQKVFTKLPREFGFALIVSHNDKYDILTYLDGELIRLTPEDFVERL